MPLCSFDLCCACSYEFGNSARRLSTAVLSFLASQGADYSTPETNGQHLVSIR